MELLDIVDENGKPIGETVERKTAHSEGIRHRTAHVWIVRKSDEGAEVLLQKRAMNKDSFPGRYDTSSAGHIQAGDEPEESAIRELHEELGIKASVDDLQFVDIIHFLRREMLDFTAFPVFFVSNLLLVQRKKYYFNRATVSRNCSIVL